MASFLVWKIPGKIGSKILTEELTRLEEVVRRFPLPVRIPLNLLNLCEGVCVCVLSLSRSLTQGCGVMNGWRQRKCERKDVCLWTKGDDQSVLVVLVVTMTPSGVSESEIDLNW